ncbi:MOT11 protein, partial [Certhia brachydactyla]|nr:MOT11 protein [Certhia brachydactyla]
LAVSGAAVSGLALTPLIPLSLEAFGWRGSLLLLASFSLHSIATSALLRPPPASPASPVSPGVPGVPAARFGLLAHGAFLRYAVSFALLDVGYYVPFLHAA